MIFTRKQAIQASSAYTTCADLPLYNFIKIQITKSLKWLIIDGEPDGLDEIWENIYSEYSELMGDTKSTRALELSILIPFLTNKLTQVDIICNYMWKTERKVPGLISLLQNEYGYRLAYDDLLRDLKRTENQSKSEQVKLKKAISDYKVMSTSGKETTEFEFTDNLRVLAKDQGYPINPKQTSVLEYVSLLKEHNRLIQQANGKQ